MSFNSLTQNHFLRFFLKEVFQKQTTFFFVIKRHLTKIPITSVNDCGANKLI